MLLLWQHPQNGGGKWQFHDRSQIITFRHRAVILLRYFSIFFFFAFFLIFVGSSDLFGSSLCKFQRKSVSSAPDIKVFKTKNHLPFSYFPLMTPIMLLMSLLDLWLFTDNFTTLKEKNKIKGIWDSFLSSLLNSFFVFTLIFILMQFLITLFSLTPLITSLCFTYCFHKSCCAS